MGDIHRKAGKLLPLITLAVFVLCSKHQFEANTSLALGARREMVSRLERGFMRQAMFCVRDFIDPRLGDHLPGLVYSLAGIGIHARDPVAWGT